MNTVQIVGETSTMMSLAKLVGVIAYLICLIVIGVLASRRMKDTRDYFAAGKKLNFWAVAFSARATGESGWLLLGLTGMGAAMGVQAFWVVLGEVLGVGAAWVLLARRFKRLTDRYDSITVPDYLESRFRDKGHAIRMVAAFTLTVFVAIYVSAQIHATGKAFHTFLEWNYYSGAAVGLAVVMVYIVSGGFLAVVWSDVFQGAMMFVGLVTLPIVGLIAAGGFGPVIEGLREQNPTLLSLAGESGQWSVMSVAIAVGLVGIGLGFLGSPQVFVRFLAMRTERDIPKGTAVALVWTLLADSGAVLIGMIGRHLYVNAGQAVTDGIPGGKEGVLPLMVDSLLPLVFIGLFMAVVLAAIMSTIDSLLVVASSAFVRDYWQKVRRPDIPDKDLMRMSRWVTFVIALVAFGIAMVVAGIMGTETDIFWYVIFGWSGIAATFCPTIMMSLFWRRFTVRGALAAMVTGFVSVGLFALLLPNLDKLLGIDSETATGGEQTIVAISAFFGNLAEMVPSFAMSFLAGILVSLFDRKGRSRIEAEGAEDLAYAGERGE